MNDDRPERLPREWRSDGLSASLHTTYDCEQYDSGPALVVMLAMFVGLSYGTPRPLVTRGEVSTTAVTSGGVAALVFIRSR